MHLEAGQSIWRPMAAGAGRRTLLCFSHLRWDFVFQRPQHLLTRAARAMRVFYWEEPVWGETATPCLHTRLEDGVLVVQPQVPHGHDPDLVQRQLLDALLQREDMADPILWYYTPQALAFSGHLAPRLTVYDCMDELSAFAGADPSLPGREQTLLRRAGLVFTGGQSLYEAKRRDHRNVHAFPSGVDVTHFRPARGGLAEPSDQRPIPHPRAGFYGVLDERLDTGLLAAVADLRPHVQFVLVGPTAKIDPDDLPRRANLHYLGAKPYAALPGYIANWQAALMPFAISEATRFISPTKTPEYLAAGLPVVSTGITDVVRQYGELACVQIARTPDAFAHCVDQALALASRPASWQPAADALLDGMSWDRIWTAMAALIDQALADPASPRGMGGSGGFSACGQKYDYLIVGAGFAGSVLAERLAADAGKRVLLIDRRPHIGGNAHDRTDAAGVLVHPYGPHIFHTNSAAVVEYLSRFTAWRPYEHRVLTRVADRLLPMPINRTTINAFFGTDLAPHEIEAFLESIAERPGAIQTAADVVLSQVGRAMYEAFFQGYTRKQWGLDPSELDKSVTSRVPTRTSDDDRYFTDRFQQMPLHGFTRMFEAMLDHPGITVRTGAEYASVDPASYGRLIFTGPIDEFFGHRYGRLPYRSLNFRHETHDMPWFQEVGVVNHPAEDVPYTRVTEFKHLTGQAHPRTSVCYEFPSAEGDPYYPVPRPENIALYRRYRALADATPGVMFVGRLATYRYYNMDQVVGQALAAYQRLTAAGRVAEAAA